MKQWVDATFLEFLGTRDDVILVSLLHLQRKQQMALNMKFISKVLSIVSSFSRVSIISSPRHGLSPPNRLTYALVGAEPRCLGTGGLGIGLDNIF